jgi:hypothetical protein
MIEVELASLRSREMELVQSIRKLKEEKEGEVHIICGSDRRGNEEGEALLCRGMGGGTSGITFFDDTNGIRSEESKTLSGGASDVTFFDDADEIESEESGTLSRGGTIGVFDNSDKIESEESRTLSRGGTIGVFGSGNKIESQESGTLSREGTIGVLDNSDEIRSESITLSLGHL